MGRIPDPNGPVPEVDGKKPFLMPESHYTRATTCQILLRFFVNYRQTRTDCRFDASCASVTVVSGLTFIKE
uniref:Uncharacterized protein n=1 Tax=Caenorhabditis japonica TaxID=281687 RepID=A0A8R1EXE9_CAEJA